MPKFSIIIPVYNRPEEVVELLDSLTMQSLHNEMEVIVVEDGSTITCEAEIEPYKSQLNLIYIQQENMGPGGARNRGAKEAKGEYLIFFDSDCVLPSDYLQRAMDHLRRDPLACFGGPDKAHKFFSRTQKAISYSMTSFLTTGGIRGSQVKIDKFYPRSFNLGVLKVIFDEVGGFSDMRYGEDIDFSMKVLEHGHRIGLISETFVYHKRRTSFKSFFKQVFSSGSARIQLVSRHKGALKLVHILPTLFLIGIPVSILLGAMVNSFFYYMYPLFFLAVFVLSWISTGKFTVALLSIVASFIQVVGYGMGFLTGLWMKYVKKDPQYEAFKQTFYN
ncbi:MAG: glycosyltransferase [Bacteroidales bacterium]|nr:glycosyltransferase [Bacteroidales bacterium]